MLLFAGDFAMGRPGRPKKVREEVDAHCIFCNNFTPAVYEYRLKDSRKPIRACEECGAIFYSNHYWRVEKIISLRTGGEVEGILAGQKQDY